jgi:predicted transcriptional regulator
MKTRKPQPTDGELLILNVLWRRGPSTVRRVHEELAPERDTGYTTTLKLLQIMNEKGLVRRDTSERSHVYEAACGEAAVKRGVVGDLLDRVFEGSARQLVMQALEAGKVSADELRQIRLLIERKERGRR